MIKAIRAILLALLIGTLALTLGCAKTNSSSSPDNKAASAALKLIDPAGKTTYFTLDDLKKLPQGMIVLSGKGQAGPTVPGLLAKAGISDYKSATFKGKTGASRTLPKSQIDKKTLLDFSNRNTVKLVSPRIPKPDWVKDLTTITVK